MITCIILASPPLPQPEELEYVQKRVLLKTRQTQIDEITDCCAVFAFDLPRFIYMEKTKMVKATISNYTLYNLSIMTTFVLLSNVSALSSILCSREESVLPPPPYL